VANPLDLPGPQFLVFYVFLAVITLGLLWVVRSTSEAGASPRIDTGDPYLIAYLRGSHQEALRVATIALIDRGLLEADTTARTIVARAGATAPTHPIEQALVRHFEQSHLATTVLGNDTLVACCAEYERRLTALEIGRASCRERV